MSDAGFPIYQESDNMTSSDHNFQAICAEVLTKLNSQSVSHFTAGRFRHRDECVDLVASAIAAIMDLDSEAKWNR